MRTCAALRGEHATGHRAVTALQDLAVAVMVEQPEQYRLSSIHANLNQRPDDLVTLHPVIWD